MEFTLDGHKLIINNDFTIEPNEIIKEKHMCPYRQIPDGYPELYQMMHNIQEPKYAMCLSELNDTLRNYIKYCCSRKNNASYIDYMFYFLLKFDDETLLFFPFKIPLTIHALSKMAKHQYYINGDNHGLFDCIIKLNEFYQI